MKNLKKGFTLVELIVVMVLVSLLLGMTALLVSKYANMERNVLDSRDRNQEISNITSLISSIVDESNEDSLYTIKVVDNAIYHGSTLLISFKTNYYVFNGQSFGYEHISSVTLITDENNKRIIYLKIDDEVIKSFRLFRDLEVA